ncbi:MAG: metallophosphoesterase [Thermodesulfobacteriota bacterium]|nr:metallophosphoesterase [Thermodesulfobacteriota bacterium]
MKEESEIQKNKRPRRSILVFILALFTIYGGINLYIFLKVINSFPLGAPFSVLLALIILIMICAPLIVRILEGSGRESLACLFAGTGYTWLGIVFLVFSLSLVVDIYHLLVSAAGFFLHKDLSPIVPGDKATLASSILIALTAMLYGYFRATVIDAEKLLIKTPKIPKEITTLTIVQISDIHLGLIVRKKRLARILSKVADAAPDILISTGDLVDGQIDELSGLAEPFQKIKPKYGKFAITGNHEYFAGITPALEFTEKAGFRILRGEAATIPGLLNIAGIDDPAGDYYGRRIHIQEKDLLANLPAHLFTLLLKHEPDVTRESLGLFDLQLSGHTHKGQIFPFNLITRIRFPFISGYYSLEKSSSLYVSRGSGTWGPPVRLFAPPEVTVIRLLHSK